MSQSKKVPTNVSVRADLVARAEVLGLNLSRLLESALEQAIRERARWLAENKDAFDSNNADMAKHGLFSDDWRTF